MMCGVVLVMFVSWHRQLDREGRTLAGAGAFGDDLAAMHVDDALDDGEAEAGRAFARRGLGGKPLEAAEQPRQVLRREACALVGDADHREALFLDDADP